MVVTHRQVLLILAVIAFACLAIAVREAPNWGWLLPAGLAAFAASHLDVARAGQEGGR